MAAFLRGRLDLLVYCMALFAPAVVVLSCGGNQQVSPRQAEVPGNEYFVGDIEEYPRPTPVAVVAVADELPVVVDDRIRITNAKGADRRAAVGNKAVELQVAASEMHLEIEGQALADDKALLVIEATAVNVHPKQEVERSRLEGQQDRTLGSGGLLRGGGGGKEEMVEVDVAYKIPRLADHIFVLADGIAYPLLEPVTAGDGLADPDSGLLIEKKGELEELRLAAVVPRQASHLALQLLDYANGHVTAPIRGKLKQARGDDQLPKDSLASAVTSELEIAALAVALHDKYGDRLAPSGLRFAVIDLVGRSRSTSGDMGNILELDPTSYLWVSFDEGYFAYSEPLASSSGRVIRFPPQLLMSQQVAFLVADTAESLRLGIRIQNEVVELQLAGRPPRLPSPRVRHADGEVMEVLLFGSRVSADRVIVDLGLKSLLQDQGVEIQPSAQFLLRAGDVDVRLDSTATAALLHPPPDPFVVPPGVSIRFELAYTTADVPSALRVRGFRGDGTIKLRP